MEFGSSSGLRAVRYARSVSFDSPAASVTDAVPSAKTIMSIFGNRRSRQTRVFRPSQSFWEKLVASLQDFQVLTRVLIALLAVVVLLVAVQSWRPRFEFRQGQVSTSGVQARVDFRVENQVATIQARADAERRARLVFVQDNAIWETLQSTFRTELTAVANAEQLKEVADPIVQSFQLDYEVLGDVEKGIDPIVRFAQVKLALTESEMSLNDRIETMSEEFDRFLAPAHELGLLDDEGLAKAELAEEDQTPQRAIEIRSNEDRLVASDGVTIADVRVEDQLQETGRLGGQWADLPNLQQIRPAVETWLQNRIRNQLTYDEAATQDLKQAAIDQVEIQYEVFAQNQILVPAGTVIEESQLEVLRAEYDAHDSALTIEQRMTRIAGAALMLTIMVVLFGVYIVRNEGQLLLHNGRLLAFVCICALAVFLSCLLSHDPWRAEIVPLLVAVIIISIVYNQMLAILTAFCLSVLISMATVANIGHFAVLMVVSFVVIIPLEEISARSKIIRVGFLAAIIAFVAVWGFSLVGSDDFSNGWRDVSRLTLGIKFAGCTFLACVLMEGMLPFVESAFDILTDISLLELSDVSHPLLQELARNAPGTYNHSISVATIGEAAADAIGANGLLLRVGAYFHDIGKGLKPEYFIENMISGQESPHTNLAPAMSALIIIGHVKDGSEMAEQFGLPRKLIDFIEQHHGTTLVEYFFREAANRADEDHRTDADESTFRYPGPKPQTRETGVMMLSDAVESASRTLSEPTPARIQSLVQEITLKRLLDGQFDECNLTMSELRVIQSSLVKSLLAVHHGRIKYPDQQTA